MTHEWRSKDEIEEQETPAEQEQDPSSNGHPTYPVMDGYICVPDDLYNSMVEFLMMQPYARVQHICRELERVSTLTRQYRSISQGIIPNH